MRRALFICFSICTLALGPASAQKPASDWTTLFDGFNLDHFNTVGSANWKLGGVMVEATSGPGFLASRALTAQAKDDKRTSGPIAPQYMAGTVRFRRLQIRRF